jgi:hypothetical protein
MGQIKFDATGLRAQADPEISALYVRRTNGDIGADMGKSQLNSEQLPASGKASLKISGAWSGPRPGIRAGHVLPRISRCTARSIWRESAFMDSFDCSS